MKKILSLFSIIFFIFFSMVSSVEAYIDSTEDIDVAIMKLNQIVNCDFFGMFNRHELIGYRLASFNMKSLQYKSEINATLDRLENGKRRIEIIENSADYSDSEKMMQINQIYQDVRTSLSEINSKTSIYLNELRFDMPSITYQRYVKSFSEYYNSIGINK